MDNHQTISNLIISYSGQQRTINIPVLYLELLEDYNVAVMLNQLIYWSDRSNRTDGYFYKNYKEWQEEVFLSQYQVKKAVDKLKKLELVETKLKKSYGSPTLHY
ncbi:MAG: replication protein, partial [Staphylococcus equorum]|nr:replication protein [Staphylococcus equorum]